LRIFSRLRKELIVTKNLFKYSVVLGIVFGTCAVAHGLAFGHGSTPEIDPSLAISTITLLAGSLAVLRIRRKK
jgi:drug/metabolite transporter (DMT)-like permease